MAARLASADLREGSSEKLSRRLRGYLDAIVLKALRKEAYRRYATADGFAEDITRHLAGLPVGASRGTWSYRFGKFAARHKAGVVVTAFSTLILIGATVVSMHFARQAQLQKELTLRIAGFAMGDLDAPSKSTSARKASLDRILSSLNQLSSDGARDPDMSALLFTGYLKAGDLQGNIYENNLGDVTAAAKSNERAMTLARPPSEIDQASMRLGDVAFNQGAFRSALSSYRNADQLLESALQKNPGQPQLWLDVTRNWYRIGFMQSQLGSMHEALDSYQRELQLARQWSAQFPSSLEVRRELALAEEHVGNMLQQTRGAAEGLPHLELSLAAYRALLNEDPESARCRRDVALGLFGVAGAFQKLGDLRKAEQHYRNSLTWIEGLMAEDPSNEQYGRDRNSILDPMAKVLYREGQLAESRRLTESTLAALRAMVDKPAPSSYDLFQYCWDLLTTPFQDLHRTQDALRLAQKAIELTRGADPGLMHVLALAWQENGNLEQAVATEGKALALYTTSEPPTPGTKRAEIVANLAALQQTLSRRAPRPK
jgi:tetratricopeptide (TPR) repeat protein